jgi:hypothetical protein
MDDVLHVSHCLFLFRYSEVSFRFPQSMQLNICRLRPLMPLHNRRCANDVIMTGNPSRQNPQPKFHCVIMCCSILMEELEIEN